MSARTKSILIIIATLLVGIAVGALSTGAIVNQRVETLQALREDGGFIYFLERVIEPTDEAQQREIRAVLDEAARRQFEIRRSIVEQHRDLFSDVRSELAEILTDEQKEKLRVWSERERQMRPPGQPPPGFPRGRREGRNGTLDPDSSEEFRRQFRPRQPRPAPIDSAGIEN